MVGLQGGRVSKAVERLVNAALAVCHETATTEAQREELMKAAIFAWAELRDREHAPSRRRRNVRGACVACGAVTIDGACQRQRGPEASLGDVGCGAVAPP